MSKNNNLLRVIGVTQDEYSMAVFNTGIEYLEYKANEWANEISQTQSFWSWWIHQWEIIDDIFYSKEKPLFDAIGKETLHAMWIEDHKRCMQDRDIEAHVWAKFYENMISASLKEVTCK
jgi:ribonucleotide reductase alpha subunit